MGDGVEIGVGRLPGGEHPWTQVPLDLPRWPGGGAAALCITFDVDAETVLDTIQPAIAPGPSLLSEMAFGMTRGLPRLLAMLDRLELHATFFVPGATAHRHPGAITAIVEHGHEVGHHGFLHLSPERSHIELQRQELERGLEALDRLGIRPRGYRAPCWEPTTETYDVLAELGFEYDSSAMGDDRPYALVRDGRRLVQLPVHWSLDDWPYYTFGRDGGHLAAPSVPTEVWRREVAQAVTEGRSAVLTLHPEASGRGYRQQALEEFLRVTKERGDLCFPRLGDVVDLLDGLSPTSSTRSSGNGTRVGIPRPS